MKTTLFYVALIFTSYCASANDTLVVDEEVLNSWGYKTVPSERNQRIRSIEKVDKPGDAYYPRFTLSKDCFTLPEEAEQENNKILKWIDELPAPDKYYRNYLIVENCLYSVTTDSNYFYLEFQPEIVKKMREYLGYQNKS